MRRFLKPSCLIALGAILATATAGSLEAQQLYAPQALTEQDYADAERFMGYNTGDLVLGGSVAPNWLGDERFWYRVTTQRGTEFLLVDPVEQTRRPAFDHERLAGGLSLASGMEHSTYDLGFDRFEFLEDERGIRFDVDDQTWVCQFESYDCRRNGDADRGGASPTVTSPDGAREVFVRDHDLWVRNTETEEETQLTRDGFEAYGYATNNAGWIRSDRPVVVWSPDSEKIVTFRHDGRNVGEMYLADTGVGHPNLEAWKYPLPGDDDIFTIEPLVVDVVSGEIVWFQMAPDPHRSTVCDHVVCRGRWADVQWSEDGSQISFVSTPRDHKRVTLRLADTATGIVRDVFEESVATFFESGMGARNWRFLPESDEVVWYSQRTNWGHLYMYDLENGGLKHAITSGEWNVTEVLGVDRENRMLYFEGVGREGRDPYFIHLYRIGFEGGEPELLTPEDANHSVTFSESGRYFVDRYSRPDTPPVAVLRSSEGERVLTLETADISRLRENGWRPPIPFSVKARDGATDLYGLMFVPTHLDESMKYPIINNVYPGPQTGSVGARSFFAARGDAQALADLGFVVVKIDGMGTRWRSKEFQDAYYGNMSDNTLPDQVSGMEQLAERYDWIDIERAGIYGHSGGGYATAAAMFQYPDFFKVGVSQAGNHDNRNYEDDWAEKWQGLLAVNTDGETNYDNQANQLLAENLEGKLLLAHGTMDTNVPFYNTLLVVDALIAANKDFDLVVLPNRGHGFGNEPYMVRRRWDYFVRHLLGAEPPAEYRIRAED